MIDFEKWTDRLQNELDLQKANQRELVLMTFTRTELIELKMMIATLQEQLKEQTND